MTDFIWTFPCYVLVAACKTGLRFASPDGHLAVFTDKDLAERFSETLDWSPTLLPLPSAEVARGFLASLSNDFAGAYVDSDRQKALRIGFPTLIQQLSE